MNTSLSFALRNSCRRAAVGLSLCTLAMAAVASGYQKGPAPTVASLEAKGPFATATATLPAGADFGSGTTVYYPTDRSVGSFGLLVLCPGFVSTASLYAGIAQRIASHGFVVTVVSTKSLTDQPKARGAEINVAIAVGVDETAAVALAANLCEVVPAGLADGFTGEIQQDVARFRVVR